MGLSLRRKRSMRDVIGDLAKIHLEAEEIMVEKGERIEFLESLIAAESAELARAHAVFDSVESLMESLG